MKVIKGSKVAGKGENAGSGDCRAVTKAGQCGWGPVGRAAAQAERGDLLPGQPSGRHLGRADQRHGPLHPQVRLPFDWPPYLAPALLCCLWVLACLRKSEEKHTDTQIRPKLPQPEPGSGYISNGNSSIRERTVRRFTWEVIRRHRREHATVLTTHSMEEADALADRIAIMAAGRLAASGTPLSLKHRFGVGYRLTLVRERQSRYVTICSL